MLDEKLVRLKALIAKRDEIDLELSQLLGIEPKKPRGRTPRTDQTQAHTEGGQ